MNDQERNRRFQRMRDHGCIACFKIGIMEQPPDVHHLNLDNKAGQKRLGADINMPLCPWHHRGVPHSWMSEAEMLKHFGPSRQLHKSDFVKLFGTDDALKVEFEDRIRMMDEYAQPHVTNRRIA